MNISRALLTVIPLLLTFTNAKADQVTVLGTSSTYGVLAASTVTNSGLTVVSGNLGLSSGSSVTGFAPGIVVNGTQHIADANAQLAIADALAGYTYLSGLFSTSNLTGTNLGGLTLGPGVYVFNTSAALTGNLTLDFGGLSNTNIVFQIGSTFTTSTGSAINVVNPGTGDNVYYAVGSSATLGSGSVFAGDIVAFTSIDLGTGASSSCGSLIALNGAVTLLSNTVTNCSLTTNDVTRTTTGDPSPVPEPSSLIMMATGVAGGIQLLRRKRITP